MGPPRSVFFGLCTQRLDATRRVMVPKAFRSAIGDDELCKGLVLTRGLDGCIWLFAREHWLAAVAELGARLFGSAEARMLERLFVGGAAEVTVDKSGRIPLPDHLCDRAGIGAQALFVGAARRIEIWNPERWRALEDEAARRYEELAEAVSRRA